MTPGSVFRHIALLGLVLSVDSCIRDDLDKISTDNYDPEFAIPLVDSRMAIDRVLKKFEDNGFLTTDEEHVVVVVYKGRIFDVSAEEVIKLTDVQFDLALHQGELPFEVPGMNLSTIDLKQGKLKVHIEDDIKLDFKVKLMMNEAKKNGIPFEESFLVHYKNHSPVVFDTVYDLSGYTMNLSGKSGQEHNKFSITYDARRVADKAVILDRCLLSFEDLSYSFLDGYLGKINMGVFKDSMRLSIFDKFKSGTIVLEDPKFAFLIQNSFGMPMQILISNFSGTGEKGSINLQGAAVNDGIEVLAPGTRVDAPIFTNAELNKDNSNISNFLAITPRSVNFEFAVDANFNGNINSYNFAYDSSRVTGDLFIELPLKGKLDSVVFEDIYAFNTFELKNVKIALFKIHTVNAFPLGVYFQLYFLDADEHTLDSLILDNDVILKEATTDARGFSINPSVEESYFSIGQLRFASIKDRASKLKLRAMLLTDEADKKTIRITSEDYFDIKIGLRAIVTYQR